MPERIVQLNEEVIKGRIKELVRGSVEETLNELLEQEAERLTQGHPGRFCVSEIRQGREWCRCGAAFALNPLGFLSPTPEVECAPKV